jgi:(p)ppGpp synthase/HD superfamily hydrolase
MAAPAARLTSRSIAMPVQLTSAYQDALALAIELHGSQTRKGTDIPYLSHLLAVSATVLEYGGTEEEAIAALLHDAIEDAGGAEVKKRIADQFGTNVADIVAACSDDSPPAGHKKRPWRIRKNHHIEQLRKASPSILLITAADKLHNARSLMADYRQLGDAVWDRFNAKPEDILWYYRSVVEALDKGDVRAHRADGDDPPVSVTDLDRLLDELEVAVEDLHLDVQLAATQALYQELFEEGALDGLLGPIEEM